MAHPRKEKFNKDDVKLAKIAKALAHPARVAIIRQLAGNDPCCFSEISKHLPLSDSTVSQHMSELRSAGLIKASYELPKIIYTLDEDQWKDARKLLKILSKMKPVKGRSERTGSSEAESDI